MKKQQMRGFLDPITLGFVLSILGTATALTLDVDSQVSQNDMKAQVTLEESVEITKAD